MQWYIGPVRYTQCLLYILLYCLQRGTCHLQVTCKAKHKAKLPADSSSSFTIPQDVIVVVVVRCMWDR